MRRQTLKKNKPRWPPKYYRGLTKKAATTRRKEILKYGRMNWRDPRAYVGFKTDIGVKTRTSSYTAAFRKMFPGARGLPEKAAATGVPEKILRASYNRGRAAWRTGHRPGATAEQWGYARVHSFLLCGKTHYGPDADLVREARGTAGGKAWFKRCPATDPTSYK